MKPDNAKIMTIKLQRREVCRLMMACTLVSQIRDSSPEWKELHDKIMEQLHDYDYKMLEGRS